VEVDAEAEAEAEEAGRWVDGRIIKSTAYLSL
jgi:hypothetical protein